MLSQLRKGCDLDAPAVCSVRLTNGIAWTKRDEPLYRSNAFKPVGNCEEKKRTADASIASELQSALASGLWKRAMR